MWTTRNGHPVIRGRRTVGWMDDEGSWFIIDETPQVRVRRVDGFTAWVSFNAGYR